MRPSVETGIALNVPRLHVRKPEVAAASLDVQRSYQRKLLPYRALSPMFRVSFFHAAIP